jgi:hypothetical protein
MGGEKALAFQGILGGAKDRRGMTLHLTDAGFRRRSRNMQAIVGLYSNLPPIIRARRWKGYYADHILSPIIQTRNTIFA